MCVHAYIIYIYVYAHAHLRTCISSYIYIGLCVSCVVHRVLLGVLEYDREIRWIIYVYVNM